MAYLLRKVSDCDVHDKNKDKNKNKTVPLDLALAPIACATMTTATATTTTAATPSSRTNKNKKRNREEATATATATSTAVNVNANANVITISDDSDSSDEEKTCTSTSTSLVQQQHKRRRKERQKQGRPRRVVFGDAASTTKYYASNLSKAELKDMKRELWFTKQNRLRSQAESLEVLKAFRIQNAEEVAQFSAVYRTSMKVPYSQASSDYLEQATVSIPLSIRGLEWGIAPKLKKRRKAHIQSILAVQKHILHDTVLRERFVASRSLQSSRPARIMARMVGEGDASGLKLGTTSTALKVVTTIPIPMMIPMKTKTPLREEEQQQQPSNITTRVRCRVTATATATSTTKIGHARRRRQFLWRK